MLLHPNDPPAPVPMAKGEDPYYLNPLVLAYIGDTLYDLHVRTSLVKASHAPAGKLHRHAITYVCAAGQASSVKHLENEFTVREREVFLRGRNAKSPTVPKHATVEDYRYATAFEAVLGYLYLSNDIQRAEELMQRAFDYRTEEVSNAKSNT